MTEQEKKEIILKASLQRISTKTKDDFDLESGDYAVIDNEYHKIPEKLFKDFLYDDDISPFNIKKSTKIKNGIFITHNDLSGGFYIKDDEGNKKELVDYDNQTGEVHYLFGNKSWYGIEELDNCEDKILEAFPKLADDKTKNYERKDQFGNPLVADWLFMYLVNIGREEKEKWEKTDPTFSKETQVKLIKGKIEEVIEENEKLDPNCDFAYQDFNEIIGKVLNIEIDCEKLELHQKFITGEKYNGYVPDMLVVDDFKHEIKKEYNEYKQTVIKNFTKEGIFDRAYEIHFYTEMNDYFKCLTSKDVDNVKDYIKYDFSLAYLYDRYLKSEFASIANGAEINDFLDNEVEREKRLTRQKDIER